MKQVANKSPGSSYTADDYETGSQQELENVVSGTVQTFDTGNQTQLGQGLSRVASTIINYKDTGAVNAYELSNGTVYFPLGVYIEGMVLLFNAANTNTGASTVNVNGLGVKELVNEAGDPLTGNEIQKDTISLLTYSTGGAGTFKFRALNATDASLAAALASQVNPFGTSLIGYDNQTLDTFLKSLDDNADAGTSGANKIGVFAQGESVTVQDVATASLYAGGKVDHTTIAYGYNLASATNNGGVVQVVFSNPIPDTNVMVHATPNDPNGILVSVESVTTTHVDLKFETSNGSGISPMNYYLKIEGFVPGVV